MTLVADSGSTKTHWILDGELILTDGINPVRDNRQRIEAVLSKLPTQPVRRIYFYGAGCLPPYSQTLREALAMRFPTAEHVEVESDMLGAARALFGDKPGIACILGTGSNSCHYDGQRIVQNTPPLGYVLGDEGSGAALGKRLVSDVLKGIVTVPLPHTQAEIIEQVYRRPYASKFLASLAPTIAQHRKELHIMIVDELRRFVQRNLHAYPRLTLSATGGVANAFEPELREAAEAEGYDVGEVVQAPIYRLWAWHG